MNFGRYYHTIRHLRRQQIWWQAKFRIWRKAFPARRSIPPPDARCCMPFPRRTSFLWPPVCARTDVKAKRFEFLNESVSFNGDIDWTSDAPSRLWAYNLHYFEYLANAGVDDGIGVIRDWMARCKDGLGWGAAPASNRIVNWIKFAADRLDAATHADFLAELAGSLHVQADWVARNPERHINGNHLLKNAVALLFAGRFLDDRRFEQSGRRMLRETVSEQFLSDGGHYERSPMYHSICLCDVLDCLNIGTGDESLDRLLLDTAHRAVPFLRAMCHPDGEIALFNDSDLGVAPPPERVFDYARRVADIAAGEYPSSAEFPDTGYFILSSGDMRMILDGGPLGPDHIPAHAHSDLFSFELATSAGRVIVDSGNYDYEASDLRRYCRSAAAHNSLRINHADHAGLWGVFRLARRPGLIWAELRGDSAVSLFRGGHDGYRLRYGVLHEREVIALGDDGFLLVDRLFGRGRHAASLRVQVHPDAKTCPRPDGARFSRADSSGVVRACGGWESVSLDKGVYCPHYGVKMDAAVIDFKARSQLPAAFTVHIGRSDGVQVDVDLEHLRAKIRGKTYSWERL